MVKITDERTTKEVLDDFNKWLKHKKQNPNPKRKLKKEAEPEKIEVEKLSMLCLKVLENAKDSETDKKKTIKKFINEVESCGGVVDSKDIKFVEQHQNSLIALLEELDEITGDIKKNI